MIFEHVEFFNFDIFNVRVSFNNVKQFFDEISIDMFRQIKFSFFDFQRYFDFEIDDIFKNDVL